MKEGGVRNGARRVRSGVGEGSAHHLEALDLEHAALVLQHNKTWHLSHSQAVRGSFEDIQSRLPYQSTTISKSCSVEREA
jgi:hypothetical protein